jgi:hypothetical protein
LGFWGGLKKGPSVGVLGGRSRPRENSLTIRSMKFRGLALIFSMAMSVESCFFPIEHTGFTPTTGWVLPARPETCYLDLIFQGSPPYPYVIIGQVSMDSNRPMFFQPGGPQGIAIERMKRQACLQGAHGLLAPSTQGGTSPYGNNQGNRTTASAVAFVYVDPAGRPLPPPLHPTVLIQPGAYPAPTPTYYPPVGYPPAPPVPEPPPPSPAPQSAP